VPAAAAIAVVNVLGAYIPYLGAFIGGAFAVLMALGEGGIGLALIMLGITLAVNLLLENLLEPVLLGDSLNLHPLLILLATSLGGLIAGMIGLILAAPLTAIVIDIKSELKTAGFFDEDR
jgi:predicted PurR-regulated permease PerM